MCYVRLHTEGEMSVKQGPVTARGVEMSDSTFMGILGWSSDPSIVTTKIPQLVFLVFADCILFAINESLEQSQKAGKVE